MNLKPITTSITCLALALGANIALAASAQVNGQADVVGEVTMTIGQAMVVPASGAAMSVARGTQIHPGDRIETAEGGHVHIRFVDGALVSVRPTSRLVIEDYQYNAANVSQSLVKFRLEKGITRAISGAAAEGAKDRFRLNTPLVAIGVRGTDFVVRTWADQTVAAVNQGAIVMAPFGEGCTAQASGPCGSKSARLLSADMGNMLVEFRNTAAQAELKPFNGVRSPETMLASSDTHGGNDQPTARDNGKPGVRSVSDDAVAAAIVEGTVRQAKDGAASLLPTTPVVTLPVVPAAPADLAWGRWGAGIGAGDFAVARAEAAVGRQVTVGNNDYVLYRTEAGPAVIPQGLGNVNFALQQSQAYFANAAGQIQAASVQGGSLSIDFGSRQFATSLNLNSAATGNVGFQASGFVRSDGIFNSVTNTQAMAGATALDGKSAGYFFEKAAAGGTLSGITLWSK